MTTGEQETNYFLKEIDFEKALADSLVNDYGWNEIIMNPTEDDLIKNWANIIFENNQSIDRLGNYPLTDSEMRQIMDKVNMCNSPYKMNQFINAQQVDIIRDNPDDINNLGKTVYLKLYDPQEISAGQSRYQVARQPRFKTAMGDRRGDVMLLINGMPVIHIELKRSKVDVTQATGQIKRYYHEGIFSHGIYSMIQIFVAMTPKETLYFANPGSEDRFSPTYFFHWEDFNNTVISDWRQVTADLLSIPMAHMMVGYYTIADDKDQALKVLRSYQYFAVSKICDTVHTNNWDAHAHRGGYIWHTTGSGKTMTSFKSAELIAKNGDADKVVFILDRVELSVQSLDEYRGFAGDGDEVQETQDTSILQSKLLSTDKDDRLIVTSIQKMAIISTDKTISPDVMAKINRKRMVFIVDECHRSVFGDMLMNIKRAFPHALMFGFTGTPVFEENAKNEIKTSDIFGDELHSYTIGSAIPDGNVLGLDPYRICTYDDNEVREKAALHKISEARNQETHSIEEVENDDAMMNIYRRFTEELQMPDTYNDESGREVHGVEHYVPTDFYSTDIHHLAVVADIMKSRDRLSKNGKFHAMLATKNIAEAVAYYRLFKHDYPSLRCATVFDASIDNNDGGIIKEDAIKEMLDDYNARYQTSFLPANYAKYKKDVAKRLAHKKPYGDVEPAMQLDLVIVVSQMLTGYDSKWVNTLYVDKLMSYIEIIQSFSRTNRLFGPDKPFGTIRYYTKPYTMEKAIEAALNLYVSRPMEQFVDRLETNLLHINSLYNTIRQTFDSAGIQNFERLPEKEIDRQKFAKDFIAMTHKLEAAKLQGFTWEQQEYEFEHEVSYTKVVVEIDEETYQILKARYKELFVTVPGEPGFDFDYPEDTYITETGTGTIDAEYLNSKFVKFIKNLYLTGRDGEQTKAALKELHKTFATLSQKDQRTATLVLHDIQSGDLKPENGKTIFDYIAEYQLREVNKQITILTEATGLNNSQLRNIMNSDVTEQNINDYSRYEQLKLTVNLTKTKEFVEKVKGEPVPGRMLMIVFDDLLRKFILDATMRDNIIKTYLSYGLTLDTITAVDKVTVEPEDSTAGEEDDDEELTEKDIIKSGIIRILRRTMDGAARGMRSYDEIVNWIFYVLDARSISNLDGIKVHIHFALKQLFVGTPSYVDKQVGGNMLIVRIEAYLKKLYYLSFGREIQPRYEGEDVTWKNVIYAIRCLRDLRYSNNPALRQLSHYLENVKNWRNNESHISPTASEKEVENAIGQVLCIYAYATGMNIVEMEGLGRDCDDMTACIYESPEDETESDIGMAAEGPISNMPEEQRMDLLKRCINATQGYKNDVFTKQRHWISVYRIAVDKGFFIDNDFAYFVKKINELGLTDMPAGLSGEYLERMVVGVYANSYQDWITPDNLGKNLSKYLDIRCTANIFKQKIEAIHPEY